MTDRQRLDDTDPMGLPVDTADIGPGDVTEPDGTSPSDPDDLPGEDDTDDFLEWLPTLWNRHRRRAELVERPSSEGADFAAYACEGRPAAASARLRPEAKVQVRTDGGPHSGRRGRGAFDDDVEANGRDAPTVMKGRRRFASRRALFGVSVAGVLVVSASLLWGTRVGHAPEVPARTTVAGTFPLPTAQTPAERTEPSAPPLPAAGLPGEPQGTISALSPAVQKPTALPLVKALKAARRTGERPGPSDGPPRAAPSPPAPPVPVKEQFFEDR
jgi:hypothetical protein